MGLSGRREKQRIPNDPRNLTWADDAAKFGQSYLSKFGWDSSQGLGASADGIKTHIKVHQKLDLLGIGGGKGKGNDPNAIAWKQNRDFENLLRRLNEGSTPSEDSEGTKIDGFHKATVLDVEFPEAEGKIKRKRKAWMDVDGEPTKQRKRSSSPKDNQSTPSTSKPPVVRHRAHRARVLASKSLASKSAQSISEILGIAPSSSSTPKTTSTPSTPLHESSTSTFESIETLTVSTKSIGDYFKDRLAAKSSGLKQEVKEEEEEWDTPRGGLGSRKPVKEEASEDNQLPSRAGIGLGFTAPTFTSTTTQPIVKKEGRSDESSGGEEEVEQKGDLEEEGEENVEDPKAAKKRRKAERAEKRARKEARRRDRVAHV